MLKLTRYFVSFSIICMSALLTATVYAADISVDSSCSLADAISAANSDAATGGCPAGSGADTITLMGNVTLAYPLPEIESEITVDGNGYTISGDEKYQIFWVEESGALTIQNATLADGRGVDDDDLFDDDLLIGGAILNFGSLEVSDSVISGNSADWGGGIYNFGSANVEIRNSEFMGNWAKNAGAIYNEIEATVRISESKFTSNLTDDRPGYGGAIYNLGHLTIQRSSFSGNTAHQDGGAIHNWGTTTISSVSFSENSSVHDGGAIHSDGWMSGSNHRATLHIVESMFTGNEAGVRSATVISFQGSGGAIFSSSTEANVDRAVFFHNSALSNGGAIYNSNAVIVRGSAFSENTAKDKGGAFANGGTAVIEDSTFVHNSAPHGGAIYNWKEANIVHSKFDGNISHEDGGAVFNDDLVIVSNSLYAGNTAGDEGGAIRGTEDSDITVSLSMFRDNSAEDGGAIYSWGELSVSRSTFRRNSAIEEGGAIANHGTASITESILAENPGGDCHLGRRAELLESSNSHIADGSCDPEWSGPITEGFCPPGQDVDGVCLIGAQEPTGKRESP